MTCGGDRRPCRVSQADADEADSDYFKRSIWLPYLDTVIVEMKDRVGNLSQMAFLVDIGANESLAPMSRKPGNELQRSNGQFQESLYFLRQVYRDL